MPVACLAFFVCCSLTAPAAQTKVKEKNGRVVIADKTKPVRRGIENWYEQNKDAFARKDVAAIMALRTSDFHTLTPDGKTNDYKFMEERTRLFVARIDTWIFQRFAIGTIEVNGDLASAYVKQDTARMQKLGDGTLHKVESLAIQRETFRKTADGWRLYMVDDIKDLGVYVDGKLLQKN